MNGARWVPALLGIVSISAGLAFGVGLAETAGPEVTVPVARRESEPAADPAVLAQGADVFERSCQACHGRAGAGGVAPPLNDGAVITRFPDPRDHEQIVRDGTRAGTSYGVGGRGTGGMPAWGAILSAEDITAVVAYERSL